MKKDQNKLIEIVKKELYTPVGGDILDQMGYYHQFLPQAIRPLREDMKLAGFAMISDYPEMPEETTDYCLSEFFMMYKYRRGGVGRKAVNSVLDKHHGKWQLKRHPHNTVSVKFCRMMNVLFLCVGKIQSGIRNGSRGNMKYIWKQENVVLLSRRSRKKSRNSRWKNVTLSGKSH